ncbi:hypothetical protein [Arthrobacter russicus]|uniref:Uncharacterized protein n=1 Tax=Arthrobacter russicus TaxID=172040 RepID=A0ABU1JGW7_9MICC|nr:hypothetical protein [Arthrobacter russicus]MDR6270621.1 hypothetical protein [Arthrobacter russicus]
MSTDLTHEVAEALYAAEPIKRGDTKDHDQPATESELPTCPACVSNEVHWADRENPDPGCFEPFEPITHQSSEPEL